MSDKKYKWQKNNKSHIWITYKDFFSDDPDSKNDKEIYLFAFTRGTICNGPKCKICGYGFCHHCNDVPQKKCPGAKK